MFCILGLNLSGNDETVTAVFHMQSVGKNILNGGEYGIEASLITTVVLALAATYNLAISYGIPFFVNHVHSHDNIKV